VLAQYSEGIIALSACLQGEIPSLLLQDRDKEALDSLNEYKKIFPDRFYIELQRHNLEDEDYIIPKLIKLAKDTDTPMVVTNDSHYLNKEDAEAHDILLCIQTGKAFDDPTRMKYNTDQLYFKSEDEMRALFPDVPQAYENTVKIANEIDVEMHFDDFIFPKIELPKEYKSEFDYLKDMVYKGAKEKYKEVTDEIKDRIEYELGIINKMGYNGYFLIVEDFIRVARGMDIPVGPGRGSAAGSIVAYLLDITRIDPLKYNLLFERFLDPGRVGMPDIDIDFCAEGRGRVIEYVRQKYGEKSVAQIVTFNRLSAKAIIKDVARALYVKPTEANEITKLILDANLSLEESVEMFKEFRDKMNSTETLKKVLKYSIALEGLIRQIGVHAAGVVIAPDELSKFVPLATRRQKGKEASVLVQFDGKKLEQLKMLKMDFLGLKTLTQIDKTLKLIKMTQKIDVDIDNVPLDDKKTFELFSNAETDGVFQFESKGMKSSLMNLKPNRFEDIIAMVALYRPGPMKFISSFIDRKHGREKIVYDHPVVKEVLKETYGITVYQEQVMNIAKIMSGFSSSDASALRKAISKKKKDKLDKLKDKFVNGAVKNNVKQEIAEKIWQDWQEFANYAFNKSHAACYAYVAYQTAYLKAHYPVEFLAAILSLEEDSDKVTNFLNVCRKMDIKVISPNINESDYEFTVNGKKIVYGLKAIKNVGSAAIKSIIEERDEKKYANIFSFCSRINLQVVNKGVLESLVMAGAMDDLQGNRAQKFAVVENAIQYGNSFQKEKEKMQLTLFDELEADDPEEYIPKLPNINEWDRMTKLINERNMLGFYFSGHPLDEYKNIISFFTNLSSKNYKQFDSSVANAKIIGLVVKISKKMSKRKEPYAIIAMEDLHGIFNVFLRKKQYESFIDLLEEGKIYFVQGRKSDFRADESSTLEIECDSIIPFDEFKRKLSGEVILTLPPSSFNKGFAEEINGKIKEHPGRFSVYFNVQTKKFDEIMIKVKSNRIFPDNNLLTYFNKISQEKVFIKKISVSN